MNYLKKRTLPRRTLLRGLGGIALALPFLDAMSGCRQSSPPVTDPRDLLSTARRGLNGFPKRLVIMFSPVGTVRSQWLPTGSETAFTLSPILSPLAAHQRSLIIPDGVGMISAMKDPKLAQPHAFGMAHVLTGANVQATQFNSIGHPTDGSAGGPSVDQAVASQVGAETRFKSLALSLNATPDQSPLIVQMTYRDKFQPIAPDNSPQNAFSRVFAGVTSGGSGPATPDPLAAKRALVVDAVKDDFKALSSKLGPEDRRRLEAHVTSIEELERGFVSTGKLQPPTCAKPALTAPADFAQMTRSHMDIIGGAFSCDLTRVVTLQLGRAEAQQTYPWLGIQENHHDPLSHAGPSNAAAQASLVKINNWYASQFAYLIEKLKSIPEGPGTVFDNSLLLWVSELSDGPTHSYLNMPFIIAGSAGGYFRTGRFIQCGGAPHNNLLVSLLNAMGVQTNTFGEPSICTGPLANLI